MLQTHFGARNDRQSHLAESINYRGYLKFIHLKRGGVGVGVGVKLEEFPICIIRRRSIFAQVLTDDTPLNLWGFLRLRYKFFSKKIIFWYVRIQHP